MFLPENLGRGTSGSQQVQANVQAANTEVHSKQLAWGLCRPESVLLISGHEPRWGDPLMCVGLSL